jgi:hypothetical protein
MAKINAQAIRGTEGQSLVTPRLKAAMKAAMLEKDNVITKHFPNTDRLVQSGRVRDHLNRG